MLCMYLIPELCSRILMLAPPPCRARTLSLDLWGVQTSHPATQKKQLYGNAEDGCRGTGEVAVDDDWVQGLYDMEGMSADTA